MESHIGQKMHGMLHENHETDTRGQGLGQFCPPVKVGHHSHH
jgi:hypothetical protein